jgi:hypothetical protein
MKACRMKAVGAILKNPFPILFLVKNHHEESLRSNFELNMTFGFPPSIDLGNEISFSGPNPLKIVNNSVILHKLNIVSYVF